MNTAHRQQISAFIWGAAALGAAALWWRNAPDRGSIPAVVEATHHTIGANSPGKVAGVFARPGDFVHAADPLIQLDTTAVDAELTVAHHVFDELLADLDALTATAQLEVRSQRQTLGAELAHARAALAQARGDEAAAHAEMGALREQIGRLDAIVQDRLTQVDRVGEMKARQERLAESSKHAPELVSAWSGLAQNVNEALGAITDEAVATRVRPLRARLETQTARIVNLIEARARLTLRAPIDGQVTSVLHVTGDPVNPGDPIVSLVATSATRVVGYAPEELAHAFQPGGHITAAPRVRRIAAEGTITAVGAEVVEMPRHLWVAPDRPRFGRPIYIELASTAEQPLPLLAGESVNVAMRGETGGAEAATHDDPAPPTIAVPEALRNASRLEASGLAWIPEWKRFLVVSDDTGPAGADIAPPWVFSLDPAVGFDAPPIPIEGVPTMSDLESVSRAPDGTVYLLASQSLSRKGKRPEKRQLLIHAAVGPQMSGLHVLSSIALHDKLTAGLDAETQASLGLDGRLDIEGMTVYGPDLLLGLKAPQDDGGRARILRLKLSTGADPLADVRVEPFRAIPLPTCHVQAQGGVSDLYLDGETLYLTSTLPEGPDCGSAWRLDLKSEASLPVKLHDYDHYKPEGISRDGSGRLWVIFDTAAAPPRMMALNESNP